MKDIKEMEVEELRKEMDELWGYLYMTRETETYDKFEWNGLDYWDADRRCNELSKEICNRLLVDKWIENCINGNKECSKLETQHELLDVHSIIETPVKLEPVIAEIEEINDLGKSKWYEVVYFDDTWHSYFGSNTFNDGERVVKWKYCKDCL